jgi:hypothetical protein
MGGVVAAVLLGNLLHSATHRMDAAFDHPRPCHGPPSRIDHIEAERRSSPGPICRPAADADLRDEPSSGAAVTRVPHVRDR